MGYWYNKKNRNRAERYFVEHGLMPAKENRTEVWVIHHKDDSLRWSDPERYREWRIEDLEPMTLSKHSTLHVSGDNNPQRKNPPIGERNSMYGVHRYGKDNPSSKPVRCITTGITYACMDYAMRDTGISYYHIRQSCNKGKVVKGFMFEWAK